MSETDIDVWVDEVCGVLIGHALFIESLCPGGSAGHRSVKWREPDKTRFKDDNGEMPLYYGQVKQQQKNLNLYGVGEAAWGVFHKEHVLSDLHFPSGIVGVVVVIEKDTVELRYRKLEPDSVLDFGASIRTVKWYLQWVEKQHLPFVIAATGYQMAQFSADEFRDQFRMRPSVPILPGPAMGDAKTHTLSFDPQFAKQVLEALIEEIKAKPS